MDKFPAQQYALQLIGHDELILNKSKKISPPGRNQILCRVEAVGLCFSDLKLLKQFSNHVRKGEIVSGIDHKILEQIPGYVPGQKPAVPGHETVVKIVAAGTNVKNVKPGERYLVQTDYRWLPTKGSNAAFGYNFEGALQQYVLMDQRIITSPDGCSMLIPVEENLAAAAVALVEPWACVEHSYNLKETRKILPDDKMLIVADRRLNQKALNDLFNDYGKPRQITFLSKFPQPRVPGSEIITVQDISETLNTEFDSVIYFGSDHEKIEKLFDKLKPFGLLNVVLCGNTLSTNIRIPVGKVHYEGLRIIGDIGFNPSQSMKTIPQDSEIKPGHKINIIGAAGPMGMMHTIRNISLGLKNLQIAATDLDPRRLNRLTKIAAPLARKNKIIYTPYNTDTPINQKFDYTVVMAPSPQIVSQSVNSAAQGGIINIFAGIPPDEKAAVDLNDYIEKHLYFLGASGSVLSDMEKVLDRLSTGKVDTNLSVAAVCGLDGAVDGLRAMEKRLIPGKIIVYPSCKGLQLTSLQDITSNIPELSPYLKNGFWNKQAEQKLLKLFS